MTQQEFKELTGLEVLNFNYVHDLYMATDLNKKEFCKDYKEHQDSLIIADVFGELEQCRAFLNAERTVNSKNEDKINTLAWKMIVKAVQYDDAELYEEAKEILTHG